LDEETRKSGKRNKMEMGKKKKEIGTNMGTRMEKDLKNSKRAEKKQRGS
jgi:hypothetical protein